MPHRITRRDLLASGALLTMAAIPGASASADTAKERESSMKLGLVSYNVARDWDLPTLLKNCQAAGVAGFEARTTHAHGIEPNLSPQRRREIRQQFADAGVVLWGLGSVCEFHAPDPAVVQRNINDCKEFVLLAKDVGARGVKVRPNGLRSDVPPDKTLEQIGQALQPCGQFGADHGVEIWVEVHGAETQRPGHMKRIMEACGHRNVGVCWNSNPTDRDENGSIKRAFDLLRPHLLSCHINDLWGDYPYRELFTLLRGSGYDRYTLCEVGASIPADSGSVFLKCYRGLWSELQR